MLLTRHRPLALMYNIIENRIFSSILTEEEYENRLRYHLARREKLTSISQGSELDSSWIDISPRDQPPAATTRGVSVYIRGGVYVYICKSENRDSSQYCSFALRQKLVWVGVRFFLS
ncbi:unnamed protein product [Cuscuta epithymum]|uniref:Uncharacterized protein n=1 Tax=Cuscuta epithymum TaxID=186058 RepID=A0AAV0DTM5_9ASTE|nr:unnamed protein product [Cuscuta epithymum]